jgi:hypothetical protein
METLHVFEIVNKNQNFKSIELKSKITIESEATLSDVLYAFERFLQAAGYRLPENSHLDFTVDE